MRSAALGLIMLAVAACPLRAAEDICETAGRDAGRKHGVPSDVMAALGLTEAGRAVDGVFLVWPWATNAAGSGRFFQTKRAAVAFARDHIAGGKTNIDLGCFQVNYHWHGENFDGIEDMLDPETNASYAAQFLRMHYDDTGDWQLAAGRYHSRTTDLAKLYSRRFAANLAAVDERPITQTSPRETRMHVAFSPAGTRSHGSLVPLSPTATTTLIAGLTP